MLFNLQKINSSFFDNSVLNKINTQEPEKQLKEEKINNLPDEIKKFSEYFYHISSCENHFIENLPEFGFDELLQLDENEKWISIMIKYYLKNKNLLNFKSSVDLKAGFSDEGIICLSKNHENYYDILTVQRIAKAQVVKNSLELVEFYNECNSFIIAGCFIEEYRTYIKIMIENEFYKILISDEYKNYCTSCIIDYLNK
ncbi:hypothetical protein GVAV_000754 [Gurleya vavrai]